MNDFSSGAPDPGASTALDAEAIAEEARRILNAVTEAGAVLRLVGSLAVQHRCPGHAELARPGRTYRDIDFVGYVREARRVGEVLSALGYAEDREVFVVSEGGRAIFENPEHGLHVDIFYEKLDFCHVIPLAGRLEAEAATVPLAELLLAKMQIVKINEKDLLDTVVLLLEHSLGEDDADRINMRRVARLCAEDWGLWRTTTMNLAKVGQMARTAPHLSDPQRAHVGGQVEAALARIEAEPKSLSWRLRGRVGDRVKWYKDVEEVR